MCLSICLSIYLDSGVPIYPSIFISIYLDLEARTVVCLFVCLSIYLDLEVKTLVCLSIYLYLEVRTVVCLSVYLSIYIHLSRSGSEDSGVNGGGLEVKVCPRCSVLIVKMDDGSCNHMTCAVCGSEFCWLCMKVGR